MLQWCPSNCQPHGTSAEGLAKNTDPVKEFAEFLGQLGKLSEMLVEPHCVARRFISARAHSGTQHAISELALLLLSSARQRPWRIRLR